MIYNWMNGKTYCALKIKSTSLNFKDNIVERNNPEP